MNLLLLLAPAFGLAHLALGRERLGRRLVSALAAPALALLAFSPMLLRAAGPAPNADLARHVFVAIRLPHHFAVRSGLGSFLPFCAWQLVGGALLLPLARSSRDAPFVRLVALLAGMLAVTWTGTLGALATERLAPLFAWRIVPHEELLLQAGTSAVLVRGLLEPALWRGLGARTERWAALGLAMLLAAYLAQADVRPAAIVAVAAVLVLARTRTRFGEAPATWIEAALSVLFANFAAAPLTRIPAHSSLLSRPRAALSELETWMRERSPKRALFLTPPDEATLRFRGERAIVVDFKSVPALPNEVLEWYRRLGDVLGRREVRGEADLASYAELDGTRLEALRMRYGFDFAVVRSARAARVGDYPRAYENAEYVVLSVAGERR